MSPDEIAQLDPEQFKELANAHNDYLELRENAYEREIADSNDPANYPEMMPDLKNGGWRPMTDEELSHEIYRLEVLANHPDHELSPEDERRRTYLETIEEQRRTAAAVEREDAYCPTGAGEDHHNREIDKALNRLVEPQQPAPEKTPPLVQRIIDRIKQAPENIRARTVDFSPLLQYDEKPTEQQPTSFLDGVLKQQRERRQQEAQRRASLSPDQRQAEDRQKQQDRERDDRDLDRW